MNELTTAAAPAPTSLGVSKVAAMAATEGTATKSASSYRWPFQITADIDADGLVKLEQMLAKYQEFLRLPQ